MTNFAHYHIIKHNFLNGAEGDKPIQVASLIIGWATSFPQINKEHGNFVRKWGGNKINKLNQEEVNYIQKLEGQTSASEYVNSCSPTPNKPAIKAGNILNNPWTWEVDLEYWTSDAFEWIWDSKDSGRQRKQKHIRLME